MTLPDPNLDRLPEIRDQSRDRRYFTMVPNIVFDLGLSSQAVALYCFYKKIAGEDGRCVMGVRQIAETMRMGPARLIEARDELVQAGLITKSLDGPKDDFGDLLPGTQRTIVVILDVWRRNVEHFSLSPSNGVFLTRNSPVSNEKQTPVSNEKRKKNAREEEPVKKNEKIAADAATPKMNGNQKIKTVHDLVRAAGVPYVITPRDNGVIAKCSAPAEDIAQAFLDLLAGRWGSKWLVDNVTFYRMIESMNSWYQAQSRNGTEQLGRRYQIEKDI